MVGAETTNLLSSTLCREADFILNIYTGHIRPKLDYGSPLWNMGYIGDTRLIEGIQRRWTRAIDSISHLPYEQRLRELDLYSMYGRMLRADLILVWKIFNKQCAISPNDLFLPPLNQRSRGHSHKLQIRRCSLDVRKRFFSLRVASTWNSLSAEAVEAPTLNSFKSFIYRDLGDELFRGI